MATVVVRNGNVDGALRTLKQKNAKDGLQKQVRDRLDGYMKPGVRRRKAKKEAIRNSRKKARKENRYNQQKAFIGLFLGNWKAREDRYYKT